MCLAHSTGHTTNWQRAKKPVTSSQNKTVRKSVFVCVCLYKILFGYYNIYCRCLLCDTKCAMWHILLPHQAFQAGSSTCNLLSSAMPSLWSVPRQMKYGATWLIYQHCASRFARTVRLVNGKIVGRVTVHICFSTTNCRAVAKTGLQRVATISHSCGGNFSLAKPKKISSFFFNGRLNQSILGERVYTCHQRDRYKLKGFAHALLVCCVHIARRGRSTHGG